MMIRTGLACLLGLVLMTNVIDGKVSYSGFQVIKAVTDQPELLAFLQEDDQLHRLNVWDAGKDADGKTTVTFHVNPQLVDDVIRTLTERSIGYTVLSRDLQSDIDAFESLNNAARSAANSRAADFDHYYNFDELQVFLIEQVALCGPNCEIINIGTSFEGRPLNLVKMIGEPTPACQQKPSIWIDAGIHAREWIAVSTGQFLINRLIEEYDTDPFVKWMRDTYDWYILPSVNPDGYTFSWTDDRLWRKTRQTYEGVTCIGADCNRNFDFQWMTVGASPVPCSDTYAGPYPNSEPEAAAQSAYISSKNGIWDMFITLHSYGQLWMSPYGYTLTLPENYPTLETVGRAAVQTILETSGKIYEFGAASQILYQSSGTSRDWAAGVPNIPYVYTIELRDENSFILPPSEIIPTGEEIWAALKTAVDVMQRERPPTCVVPAGQRHG